MGKFNQAELASLAPAHLSKVLKRRAYHRKQSQLEQERIDAGTSRFVAIFDLTD